MAYAPGTGWNNWRSVENIEFDAPEGRALISVVVIGHQTEHAGTVLAKVRNELLEWFGDAVEAWRHIKTYQISHALPEQRPPVRNPTSIPDPEAPGLYVCGEYNSVPGIQWSLLPGRRTAEQIIKHQQEGSN